MVYAKDEERLLIEQMIFLPLVKKVLEYDTAIMKAHMKLPYPYLKLNEEIFRTVSHDLSAVKREIYQRRMKVFEEERDETSIVYKAYVRGYEEKRRYAFIMLKNKTEQYLANYLEKVRRTERKQGATRPPLHQEDSP